MKRITITKQDKDWGITWARRLKIIYISLGKIGIQFWYGKVNLFDRRCLVCGERLQVSSSRQIVKYHKACRKFRNKKHVASN